MRRHHVKIFWVEKKHGRKKVPPSIHDIKLAAIDEARANSFGLFIINSKDAPEMQNDILKVLGA